MSSQAEENHLARNNAGDQQFCGCPVQCRYDAIYSMCLYSTSMAFRLVSFEHSRCCRALMLEILEANHHNVDVLVSTMPVAVTLTATM